MDKKIIAILRYFFYLTGPMLEGPHRDSSNEQHGKYIFSEIRKIAASIFGRKINIIFNLGLCVLNLCLKLETIKGANNNLSILTQYIT